MKPLSTAERDNTSFTPDRQSSRRDEELLFGWVFVGSSNVGQGLVVDGEKHTLNVDPDAEETGNL